MSEMLGKGARIKGADMSYLAARDSDVVQCAQRGGQGFRDALPLHVLHLIAEGEDRSSSVPHLLGASLLRQIPSHLRQGR
jgi:hypothetical protein